MPLRTVRATRYVTPLREGGSLPAIIEADDLGLYVLKFRGAGQGPLALAAELIAGEIGRLLGLNIPELVFVELDPALGRNEPDYEIRQLLTTSAGRNLALDYLPGSVMFNPAARDAADPDIASIAVWFDAFVTNIDRTPRNPNLLTWHKRLYFIDHGAALYFHHNWDGSPEPANSPFPPIRQHVLLRWATRVAEIDPSLRSRLTDSAIDAILRDVPDNWLIQSPANYLAYFKQRRDNSAVFVQEVLRARAGLV